MITSRTGFKNIVQPIKVLLIGLLLSLSAAASAAETITFIHTDVYNSPVAASDASSVVIWREDYQPYGKKIKKEPGAASQTVWYTGKPQDPDSGLVYMGARHYNPQLGRFISVDPVSFQEGNIHSFNRYAYGNNNPYKYVDPDGEFGEHFLFSMKGMSPRDAMTVGSVANAAAIGTGVAMVGGIDTVSDFGNPIKGGIKYIGKNVAKSGGKLPIYDARTLKRMGDDKFHNFPASFEKSILSQKPIVRTNGRSEFLQQGSINGKKGVFHITTDNGGKVMRHRAFIPDIDWARYSKRWELPSIGQVAK